MNHAEYCEAWKQAGLFELSFGYEQGFVQARTGRFFWHQEYYWWFEEMESRYGDADS